MIFRWSDRPLPDGRVGRTPRRIAADTDLRTCAAGRRFAGHVLGQRAGVFFQGFPRDPRALLVGKRP